MISKFTQTPSNIRLLAFLITKYKNYISSALTELAEAITGKENTSNTMLERRSDYECIHSILLDIDRKIKTTTGCLLKESEHENLLLLADEMRDIELKTFIQRVFIVDESIAIIPSPAASSSAPSEEFNALLTFWNQRHLRCSPTPEEDKSVAWPMIPSDCELDEKLSLLNKCVKP